MKYGLYRIGYKKGKKIIPTNEPIELWGNVDCYGNQYEITKTTVSGVFIVIKL